MKTRRKSKEPSQASLSKEKLKNQFQELEIHLISGKKLFPSFEVQTYSKVFVEFSIGDEKIASSKKSLNKEIEWNELFSLHFHADFLKKKKEGEKPHSKDKEETPEKNVFLTCIAYVEDITKPVEQIGSYSLKIYGKNAHQFIQGIPITLVDTVLNTSQEKSDASISFSLTAKNFGEKPISFGTSTKKQNLSVLSKKFVSLIKFGRNKEKYKKKKRNSALISSEVRKKGKKDDFENNRRSFESQKDHAQFQTLDIGNFKNLPKIITELKPKEMKVHDTPCFIRQNIMVGSYSGMVKPYVIEKNEKKDEVYMLPEGFGKMRYNDLEYEGMFERGLRNGRGLMYKITDPNGTSIRGSWKDDKPVNECTILYGNGDKYIGECNFVKPKPEKIIKLDLNMFKRHGKGTFLCQSEAYLHHGKFDNDKRDGFGITDFFLNGDRYIGSWKNDKFHKFGCKSGIDGTFYYGKFKNGQKIGKGRYHLSNGYEMKGEWNSKDHSLQKIEINEGKYDYISEDVIKMVEIELKKSQNDSENFRNQNKKDLERSYCLWSSIFEIQKLDQQFELFQEFEDGNNFHFNFDKKMCYNFLNDETEIGYINEVMSLFCSYFNNLYEIQKYNDSMLKMHKKNKLLFAKDDVKTFLKFIETEFFNVLQKYNFSVNNNVMQNDTFLHKLREPKKPRESLTFALTKNFNSVQEAMVSTNSPTSFGKQESINQMIQRIQKNTIHFCFSNFVHQRIYDILFRMYEMEFKEKEILLKQKVKSICHALEDIPLELKVKQTLGYLTPFLNKNDKESEKKGLKLKFEEFELKEINSMVSLLESSLELEPKIRSLKESDFISSLYECINMKIEKIIEIVKGEGDKEEEMFQQKTSILQKREKKKKKREKSTIQEDENTKKLLQNIKKPESDKNFEEVFDRFENFSEEAEKSFEIVENEESPLDFLEQVTGKKNEDIVPGQKKPKPNKIKEKVVKKQETKKEKSKVENKTSPKKEKTLSNILRFSGIFSSCFPDHMKFNTRKADLNLLASTLRKIRVGLISTFQINNLKTIVNMLTSNLSLTDLYPEHMISFTGQISGLISAYNFLLKGVSHDNYKIESMQKIDMTSVLEAIESLSLEISVISSPSYLRMHQLKKSVNKRIDSLLTILNHTKKFKNFKDNYKYRFLPFFEKIDFVIENMKTSSLGTTESIKKKSFLIKNVLSNLKKDEKEFKKGKYKYFFQRWDTVHIAQKNGFRMDEEVVVRDMINQINSIKEELWRIRKDWKKSKKKKESDFIFECAFYLFSSLENDIKFFHDIKIFSKVLIHLKKRTKAIIDFLKYFNISNDSKDEKKELSKKNNANTNTKEEIWFYTFLNHCQDLYKQIIGQSKILKLNEDLQNICRKIIEMYKFRPKEEHIDKINRLRKIYKILYNQDINVPLEFLSSNADLKKEDIDMSDRLKIIESLRTFEFGVKALIMSKEKELMDESIKKMKKNVHISHSVDGMEQVLLRLEEDVMRQKISTVENFISYILPNIFEKNGVLEENDLQVQLDISSLGVRDKFLPKDYLSETNCVPYEKSIKILNGLKDCQSLVQKFEVLTLFETHLHKEMKEISGETTHEEDDILPITLYCLLKCEINHYAHYEYLRDFQIQWDETGKGAKMLMRYEVFFKYIQNLDPYLRTKQGELLSVLGNILTPIKNSIGNILKSDGGTVGFSLRWFINLFNFIYCSVGFLRNNEKVLEIKEHQLKTLLRENWENVQIILSEKSIGFDIHQDIEFEEKLVIEFENVFSPNIYKYISKEILKDFKEYLEVE